MTISLTIFIIATVLGLGIVGNKKRETTGSWHVRLGSDKSDVFFTKVAQGFKLTMHALEINSLKKTGKRSLHYVEKQVIGLIEKMGHRFETAGHVVMGRHIPRNRGSVSFFLKNIENRKKGGLIK